MTSKSSVASVTDADGKTTTQRDHKTLAVPETTTTTGKGNNPASPKLSSYRGTADKCRFEGDAVRHFNAGKLATFELRAPGHKKEDVEVNIISEFVI